MLRLPERSRLREFVRDQIEPALRAQLAGGRDVLEVTIDDESAGLQLRINRAASPYNSGSYAAYNMPTIKDQNPLYNALRSKAGQLRGAGGIVGVIVGDADSRTLGEPTHSRDEVSARAIADEFLRQYSSIHFVLLLSVREELRSLLQVGPVVRKVSALLVFSKTSPPPSALKELFRGMLGELPKPIAMPDNAALSARASGYGWGFHGGGQMSRSKIKISAREVLEVLAGRRTAAEMNSWHQWSSQGDGRQSNTMPNPFERRLLEGRLPVALKVLKGTEDEPDDWIEIEFGDPDPAIAQFR